MSCTSNLNMLIYVLLAYRGIVSMVAHRSPKPPVWVRVLLPLPIITPLGVNKKTLVWSTKVFCVYTIINKERNDYYK